MPVNRKRRRSVRPRRRMKRRRAHGRGDYKDVLKWGSRIGGTILGGVRGFATGGLPGAAGGAVGGYMGGSKFSKLQGWGDYGKPTANQIIAGNGRSPAQLSVNAGDMSGDIYFSHTEYIGDIVATTPASANAPSLFNIQQFPINVGLPYTFPFLSQIANNFTLYELEGLVFQYKPTSGEFGNGASVSLGKVVLATNYDPDCALFTNSVQMENYDYSQSVKPSIETFHGVETKGKKTALGGMKYIRTGAVGGTNNKDKAFCDYGVFQVATQGITDTSGSATAVTVGELWASYRVHLSRANLFEQQGLSILQDCFKFVNAAAHFYGTTNTVANSAKSSNNIGIVLAGGTTAATSLLVTFPSFINYESFQVSIYCADSNGLATQYFVAPGTNLNCAFFEPTVDLSGTGNIAAPSAAAGASNLYLSQFFFVTLNAPGQAIGSFNINISAAVAATTTTVLIISQCNPNINLSLV